MRILIADDNAHVRRAIRALLSRETGLEVCGEASDGWQTLDKVREFRPACPIPTGFRPRGGYETNFLKRKS
jgi:DNA-binding NarL/FixJ family response regulator